MTPADILLDHFDRLAGSEPRFVPVSDDGARPAMYVAIYRDFPERGALAGFTMSLSHFHPSGVPAGKPRSQKRNRQARDRAKTSTSSGARSRAWPVMQVCSVSSLTMPRPNRKRWRRGGSPKSLAARLRESPLARQAQSVPDRRAQDHPGDALAPFALGFHHLLQCISTSASRSLAAATWS